jgi:hypothetical protein
MTLIRSKWWKGLVAGLVVFFMCTVSASVPGSRIIKQRTDNFSRPFSSSLISRINLNEYEGNWWVDLNGDGTYDSEGTINGNVTVHGPARFNYGTMEGYWYTDDHTTWGIVNSHFILFSRLFNNDFVGYVTGSLNYHDGRFERLLGRFMHDSNDSFVIKFRTKTIHAGKAILNAVHEQNLPPTLCDPCPPNNSLGIHPYPQLSIMVADPDISQTLTVCFWENDTTGGDGWVKIQQNTSIGSSQVIFRVLNASFASHINVKYWWLVTASDGVSNVSMTSCFTVENSPPFTLPNDLLYESSIKVHNGQSYSDQVVHADLLYFPEGWGDVNGSKYEYWLSVQGYVNSNDDTEQPCILASHNISNDSWVEPAGNFYNTNPISHYVYSDGKGAGHYDDGEIAYDDSTDQILYFINNHTAAGMNHYEIYRSSNGVTWQFYDYFLPFGNDFGSISVIKDGSIWKCWGRNGSMSPAVLEYHTSLDAIHWTTVYNCGYGMVAPGNEVWHLSINQYDGQYWCLMIEDPAQLGGENARMWFVNSCDGMNWTGYDSLILNVSHNWDNDIIYRGDFIVQDGFLKGIYTAKGNSEWHAGYTYNMNVGGTGTSSNIVSLLTRPKYSLPLN